MQAGKVGLSPAQASFSHRSTSSSWKKLSCTLATHSSLLSPWGGHAIEPPAVSTRSHAVAHVRRQGGAGSIL